MVSTASVASTIFDGLEDERLDIIREARSYVSTACRTFIEKYDEAVADKENFDAAAEADFLRLMCIKKAWRFVDQVRDEFSTCSDFDIQGRENAAVFIKRYQEKIVIRPVIQEELRDIDGYKQPFPTREDVALWDKTRSF